MALEERKPNSQALIPRFIPLSFSEMKQTAAIVAIANAQNLTKEEAMLKIMRGQEIGVPAIASLTTIHIIKGKKGGLSLTYDYTLELALIRKNMPNAEIEWIERSDKACKARVRRNDTPANKKWVYFEYTHEEAEKAKLLTKDNWIKWERRMLVTKVVHDFTNLEFSDIVYGIKNSPESIFDWETAADTSNIKKTVVDAEFETDWDNLDKAQEEKDKIKQEEMQIAAEKFKAAAKKSSGTFKIKSKIAVKTETEFKKLSKKDPLPKLKIKKEIPIQDPTESQLEEANEIIDDLKITQKFDPNKKLSLKKKSKKTIKKKGKKTTKKKGKKPAKKSKKKDISKTKIPSYFDDVNQYDLVQETLWSNFNKFLPWSLYLKSIHDVVIEAGFPKDSAQYQKIIPALDEVEKIAGPKNKIPMLILIQSRVMDIYEDELTDKIIEKYYIKMARRINEFINVCSNTKAFSSVDFWKEMNEQTNLNPIFNEWIEKFLTKNKLMKFDAPDNIPRWIGGKK